MKYRSSPLVAFFLLAAGCFQAPSEAPPPPAGQTGTPRMPAAGRDTMAPMPPDPRQGGGPAPSAPRSGASRAVGTTTLPAEPVAGSALNRFFPKNGDGYNVTYTQEKAGTVVAEVTQSGKRLANLSVADAAANPSARDKYRSNTQRIAGYPAATIGSQGTAILVGDRYQVQVRSADPSFGADQRAAWLQKFDLAGLEGLK